MPPGAEFHFCIPAILDGIDIDDDGSSTVPIALHSAGSAGGALSVLSKTLLRMQTAWRDAADGVAIEELRFDHLAWHRRRHRRV